MPVKLFLCSWSASMRTFSRLTLVILVCGLVSPLALHGQQTARREHAFHGKVENVDVQARTLTVDGDTVEGWMKAMTMTYRVDQMDVLTQVKPGDHITATVYDGDFTMLHSVRVAVAEAAPSNHKQNSQLDTKEKFRAKKIRRLEPAGAVCYRVDPAGAQGEQTQSQATRSKLVRSGARAGISIRLHPPSIRSSASR